MVTCATPANAGQLSSGDPEGGNSCVSYSYSYSACDVTDGIVHPSGEKIRDWTGDHRGGLELDQCDVAMHVHTVLEYDTRVVSWEEYNNRLDSDQGAVTIGGYAPIARSRFSGQLGFHSNHGIWVPSSRKVMDPLADGRHPTTYEYHGEVYPTSLIHAFTSALELSDGRDAGPDHVEASFIRMGVMNAPAIHYHATVTAGLVGFYRVNNGVATRAKLSHTGGFSAACSSSRLVKQKDGSMMRVVKLLDGFRKGYYINTGNPRVSVKVVP